MHRLLAEVPQSTFISYLNAFLTTMLDNFLTPKEIERRFGRQPAAINLTQYSTRNGQSFGCVFFDRHEMGALVRTLRGVCGGRTTTVWAASAGECLEVLVEDWEGGGVWGARTRRLRGGNTKESSLFAVYVIRRRHGGGGVREGENG